MRLFSKFFFLFLASFSSACVYAGSYRVTAKTLNVRESASSKSAIVYKLSEGDVVEGEPAGLWIEIEHQGHRGFVFSKYVERVEISKSSNYGHKDKSDFSFGSVVLWILGFLVVFFVGKWALRRTSWKGILFLVAIAIVVPLVGKFILGIIGLPTVGYILGWVLVVIAINEVLSGNSDDKSKASSDDWNNNPDLDYEDRKQMGEQRQPVENDDDFDDDDNFENRRDDNEERLRQHEKEQEEEKERERQRFREVNEREAAEWHRKYDEFREKAKTAKDLARLYRDDAENYIRKARESGDDNYLNYARDYCQNAEKYEDEFRVFQQEADNAERQWNYYNSKKWDF